MDVVTYKLFSPYKNIAHFCTTRHGGVSVGNYASNNISPFSGDCSEDITHNLSKLSEHLGVAPEKIIIPYQNHGHEIREIDAAYFQLSADEKRHYLYGVDAVFTRLKGCCIGITTADCVPLLFYDPVQQMIAAAHAGWRGTCARIASKTISAMVQQGKSNPSDIRVAIGPSISAKVYQVGEEVVEQFNCAGFDLEKVVLKQEGSYFLDLWEANRQSLLEADIQPQHIELSGICTYSHHERFYSARRLGIKSGRLYSGIMIKNSLSSVDDAEK